MGYYLVSKFELIETIEKNEAVIAYIHIGDYNDGLFDIYSIGFYPSIFDNMSQFMLSIKEGYLSYKEFVGDVVIKNKRKWYTLSDLKRMGFTDKMISMLPSPELRQNPYFIQGSDMKLWEGKLIDKIRQSDEFYEWLIKCKKFKNKRLN